MRTAQQLCEDAIRFTDSGSRENSQDWRRDPETALWNEFSVEDALSDLHVGSWTDKENEIYLAIRKIETRYALADEMRQYLERSKQDLL